MKIKSTILNILLILILGGIGGVLMDRSLIPYLGAHIPFLKESQPHTTIINKTEKEIIQENTALQDSIEKVINSVISVECQTKKEVFHQGTGIILTGDGLILTNYDLTPSYCSCFVRVKGEKIPADLIRINATSHLALIKIEQSNLPTVSLGKFNELRLGERVFLIGIDFSQEVLNHKNLPELAKFVNQAIIKNINKKEIKLNITEIPFGMGSPLFNIKGELIGSNLIDINGNIKVVPINIVKEFIR